MMNVALGTIDQVTFQYQFGIGERKFYTAVDQRAWLNRTTPLQSVVNGIVMTVECEQFIYLVVFKVHDCNSEMQE